MLSSGKNIGTKSPDSDPFSDKRQCENMGILLNLFSLNFLIHQLGMIFCGKASPLGILVGPGPTTKLLRALFLSRCLTGI